MKEFFSYRGAVPFLLACFMNAFVDLGHKILIQNTIFETESGVVQVMLTAIVNALILLPFIVFFVPAGRFSDRKPKHKVLQITAWLAVGLTLLVTFAYYQGWFWVSFGATVLLAIQATFYAPAKNSFIPLRWGKQNLVSANGVIQATVIVAILLGSLIFSVGFEYLTPLVSSGADATNPAVWLQSFAPLGWLLVVCSLAEAIVLMRLPQVDEGSHDEPAATLAVDTSVDGVSERAESHATNSADSSHSGWWDCLQPVLQRRLIWLSVLGISLFWSVGQVMVAVFPAFAKESGHLDSPVLVQAILACSGIGIGVGSAFAARLSRRHIATGLILIGAIGIAVGLVMLPCVTSTLGFALAFLIMGIGGGLFLVPLNALIQFHSQTHELGRVSAGNNLGQNLMMLLFLGITVLTAQLGLSSEMMLWLMAAVGVGGVFYTVSQMPQVTLRMLMRLVFRQHYRLDVQGIEHLPSSGGVLLLGNHISWIDWAIIQLVSPRSVRFVMLRTIYEKRGLKWIFKIFGCIPISNASSKQAMEEIAGLLNQGEVVCLFPEGSISRNGHLGEFHRGFEVICRKVDTSVVIMPFYLRGLWGSYFSRASQKIKSLRKSGHSRELVVAFGQPMPYTSTADEVKQQVFSLSVHSWHTHVESLPSLTDGWIDSAKTQGLRELAIADTMGTELTALQALVGAIALSRRLQRLPGQNIGILLPTGAAGILVNMATLLAGKTIVNLNYTASQAALSAAVSQAQIQTVITSKKFLDKLAGKGSEAPQVVAALSCLEVENLFKTIHKQEKMKLALAVFCLPAWVLKWKFNRSRNPLQPATILFSSGSEGLPKGVVLSHRNIMANLKQISDVLNTQDSDVVMSCLPLFHAFGLTVNQFMPLIESIPAVCHADPTDAMGIAKAIARYHATILCGTSTFLRLYAKNPKVHPLMFESLRIVVAGAEKLNPDVRRQFADKFNKQILEGYGATETTPVVSVNLPDCLDHRYFEVQLGQKKGSVGMALPGTCIQIVDPVTFEPLPVNTDGMILIGGPQVMQEYLNQPEKTASVIREIDGIRWYVTGDKGHLDEDGFLFIVDRYSRFAKIGGEMISLSAVEAEIQRQVPDCELVAVNLPDDKKGELIVVLINQQIDLNELKKQMIAAGCNPLAVPAHLAFVESIPKLGSGKTDFAGSKQAALAVWQALHS